MVAVGLVNTLTAGEAHGRPYLPPGGDELPAAVTAVLRAASPRYGEVPPDDAKALSAAVADFRAVFEAVARDDVDTAARQVNGLLGRTGARPALDRHDGEGWHLHFHGAEEDAGQRLGGRLRHRAGHCARHRRPRLWGLHGAAVRPRLRGHLPQRHPAVLLHELPEPGQDGFVPVPQAPYLTRGAIDAP